MIQPVFDSHVHIIDSRFPLVPNNGFLPDNFTVDDYLDRVSELDIRGGVVVSGSFQDLDHTYLIDALSKLGTTFVGVVNVADSMTDTELIGLAGSGVRGIRFNLYRGGPARIDDMVMLGNRAWHVAGMHSELYLDAKDLEQLESAIRALPKVSIDHLGMSADSRDVLLRLVSSGVHVKATGFGRVDLDVASTIQQIHEENPAALMIGTDLPGTRARRSFHADDIQLVVDILAAEARAVLHDNGALFYSRVT